MTRILSGDILIADLIVQIDGNPQLGALVEKHRMRVGEKKLLNDEQLKEFSSALEGVPVTVTPGGSSANMLTTLCKLLGKEIEIRFLGMAGEGKYGDLIRDGLHESGITLVPERFPACHISMQPAVSFVFVYPDGQCTIATHTGNAREILKPAMIAEHLVKNSEYLLVQGSLWHKLPPEFADRLVKLCDKHNRELWLTLPTQSDLSKEDADKFLQTLPAASLVFGNAAELDRLYHLPLDESLQHLQKIFRDRERASENKGGAKSKALGFITFGKDGAAVVGPHGVDFVPPMSIDAGDIVNTLGAGDTSYAGFAAGYLKKLPDLMSAQVAMTLAGEKLRIKGSRLADPKTTLNTVAPVLAQMLRNV